MAHADHLNCRRRRATLLPRAVVLLFMTACANPLLAEPMALVVDAGRPFRVALDHQLSVKRVGQPVNGYVVESVYAYDRIVIPAGTAVRGHIARLVKEAPAARARSYAGGDFSPPREVVLQFDSLLFDDGREMPINTVVTGGFPDVQRSTAKGAAQTPPADADQQGPDEHGVVARTGDRVRRGATDAMASAKQHATDTFAAIKQPGRMSRLKDAVVARLPWHPQYLAKGQVYDVALVTPLRFGPVDATPRAAAGVAPQPDSILSARLETTLDSAKTPRGTGFEALLTEPVFSSDHELVLPEGTTLTGEVTQAEHAKRFHRNGRLRFLFETVHVPGEASMAAPAALYSVQASASDHVAVDEEGGTTLTNSKTRFVAPALGLLMLQASVTHYGRRSPDPDGDGHIRTAGAGAGGTVGGFLGFGLLGVAISHLSRPAGLAFSIFGIGRGVYRGIFGKGRDVSFPADTPIQVRLAPAPAPHP